MQLTSQVLITTEIEKSIQALEALRENQTIIEILAPSLLERLVSMENDLPSVNVHRFPTEKEQFSVGDAKLAIEKAYMASEEVTIIILVAKIFSPLVQNKLLKVIEEPPRNKEFILITENRATLLGTIRSRLPMRVLSEAHHEERLDLDLNQLSLGSVYTFIQTHKRTDAKTMQGLVERIAKEAMVSQRYDLDEKSLQLFEDAFVALDAGSPPQFILNTLLLKLLARQKR